jgi:hypothetical protein
MINLPNLAFDATYTDKKKTAKKSSGNCFYTTDFGHQVCLLNIATPLNDRHHTLMLENAIAVC